MTLADAKALFHNKLSSKSLLAKCESKDTMMTENTFDFRLQYPHCVNPIYNQGTNSSKANLIVNRKQLLIELCNCNG